MRRRFGLVVVTLALGGCAAGPAPLPTWPVSPEQLPAATVALSADFGPARWELDPSFAAPTADTTQLHILVWEQACSNGSPATGRISAPVVQYAATTVTITLGVRPLEVGAGTLLTCPGPPGTPATMDLAEPLGQRTLIDGSIVAPDPTSPANR